MTSHPALILDQGQERQIPAADTLLTGNGVDASSVGKFTIAPANAGTVAIGTAGNPAPVEIEGVTNAKAGLVAGAGSLDASALLQSDSTTQGWLKPRMTNAQLSAIAAPVAGLSVFDTTDAIDRTYDGSKFVPSGQQVTTGLLAARPAPTTRYTGLYFYASDEDALYFCTGSEWKLFWYNPAIPNGTTAPLARWTCDETAGSTLANSGSAVGADLTIANTTKLVPGFVGILDRCINCVSTTADTSAAGAAGVEPANFTCAMWINVRFRIANYGVGLEKAFSSTTWTANEWSVIGCALNNTNDGQLLFGVRIGGSFNVLTPGAAYVAQVGVWHHVGCTFDGTTLRAYLDGNQIGSLATPGAVNYGDGNWIVGGVPAGLTGAPNYYFPGKIDDIRVYGLVQNEAWFRQAYQRGIRNWSGS